MRNKSDPTPCEAPRVLGSFYVPHSRIHPPHSDQMVTIQSAKDSCDINKILSQFKRTGIITHVNNARPTYTDLPEQHDYQEALHLIMTAESAFEGLPSKVRDHFGNDPARLLAALSDPAQAEYLREVGILKPAPGAAPLPAEGSGSIPPPSTPTA